MIKIIFITILFLSSNVFAATYYLACDYGINLKVQSKKIYIKNVDSNEYENYTKHVVKWTDEIIQINKEVEYSYINPRCWGSDGKYIKNCKMGGMRTGNDIITIDRLTATFKYEPADFIHRTYTANCEIKKKTLF
jgi:hypothetical protein